MWLFSNVPMLLTNRNIKEGCNANINGRKFRLVQKMTEARDM